MTALRLHFEDLDSTLTPLVDEAIKAGATADRDATNNRDNSFNLTFKTKRQADAFVAKLPKWALISHDEGENVEAPEAVEPSDESTD